MALKCKNCKNCIKCKLITFGKVNKKFFLIVFGGIAYSLQMYIESESDIFGGEVNDFPILYTMGYSICLCLSFIFLILYKVKNKNKIYSDLIENRCTYALDNRTIIGKKIKMISWKEKLSWILLVAIIDFVGYLFSSIYWLKNDNYVDTLQTNIVFMAIFALLILKTKLYRHHILCIIIVLVRGLAYYLIFNVFDPDFKEEEFIPNVVSFVTEIGFSLTYVMYKYYMMTKFMYVFEIMFFEGVFELFFSIMTLIIARSMGKLDKLEDFVSKFKGIEILLIISWILAGFIYHSLLFKIIDCFTPFYIHMSIIISEIISLFLRVGEEMSLAKIIFYVLSFIICPFMILVFLEIIELNFCGLSEMTKKNIALRAKLDAETNEESVNYKDGDDEISIDNDRFSIMLENSPIPKKGRALSVEMTEEIN